jgi:hypothetical protein
MSSVFFNWMSLLPMQQQTVLVLALRGPDGMDKFHQCKPLIRAYRACILKQAYTGKEAVMGAPATDSFSSLENMLFDDKWLRVLDWYLDSVDCIPHHYHLHLMHGAEILGYHHPNDLISHRWRAFYARCCEDMHVNVELPGQLERRLNDGGRA